MGVLRTTIGAVAKASLRKLVNPFRFEDKRRLFWSPYYPSNFGELVGPFLYERITGNEPWFMSPNDISRSSVYMSAGSIMGLSAANAIVWGSGILYRDFNFVRPWRVLAVRGPYTHQAFRRQGYSCPELFGDPAIVLPLVYSPPLPSNRFAVGVIPHFRDIPMLKERIVHNPDIVLIDVRHPLEEVVEQIRSCQKIISSSLHGIIVAHAYGIPAQWAHFSYVSGDGIKYHDFFASLGYHGMTPIDCSKASRISIELLDSWVSDAPRIDCSALAKELHATCPFPARPQSNREACR